MSKPTFNFQINPGGGLLNSRTVVEKKQFVSTGILTYAEGDIMEIEISDYKAFELGDVVKLTVYSPGGIHTFMSNVVAKDNGALIVINPPQNQNRFTEKREHPRIEVQQDGLLLAIWNPGGREEVLGDKISLTVHNISINGIGFILPNEIGLSKSHLVDIDLDLGFDMLCRAEIMRTQISETGIFYGARYVDLAGEKANALRAFVLKKQVENHFTNKKNEHDRRLFN